MRKMLFIFLISCVALHAKKEFTVVLDPGHGGVYIGTATASGNLIEKNITLDIAKRVAERLRKRGIKVILTRTEDTQLDADDLIGDLSKRAQLATDNTADAFVSIHINGSANKRSEGYEVYVPYEAKFPIKSYQLASALHYDLTQKIEPQFKGGSLGNLNRIDRGIKAARFNVIKKTTCPTALVELAYLTHEETQKKLLTDEYRDLLADTVASGIRRYRVHAKS